MMSFLLQESFDKVEQDASAMISILGRVRQALDAQGIQVSRSDHSIITTPPETRRASSHYLWLVPAGTCVFVQAAAFGFSKSRLYHAGH